MLQRFKFSLNLTMKSFFCHSSFYFFDVGYFLFRCLIPHTRPILLHQQVLKMFLKIIILLFLRHYLNQFLNLLHAGIIFFMCLLSIIYGLFYRKDTKSKSVIFKRTTFSQLLLMIQILVNYFLNSFRNIRFR